jgi:hypothetical protein
MLEMALLKNFSSGLKPVNGDPVNGDPNELELTTALVAALEYGFVMLLNKLFFELIKIAVNTKNITNTIALIETATFELYLYSAMSCSSFEHSTIYNW